MSQRVNVKRVNPVLLVAFALMLVFIGRAAAFDRPPVRLSRLNPDSASQTITNMEALVRERYAAAKRIRCTGVIMIGKSGSFTIKQGTRWWDKLYCWVENTPTSGVKFVADPKSADNWTLYRLKPWKPGNVLPALASATAKAGGGGSSNSGGSNSGGSNSSSGWVPGSAYYVSEEDVQDFIFQRVDSADSVICQGLSSYGYQTSTDEYLYFKCTIYAGVATCSGYIYRSVKGTKPGYFSLRQVQEGDCY